MAKKVRLVPGKMLRPSIPQMMAAGFAAAKAARAAGFEPANRAASETVRQKARALRETQLDQVADRAPEVLANLMLDSKTSAAVRANIAMWIVSNRGHGTAGRAAEGGRRQFDDLREVPLADLERIVAQRFDNMMKNPSGRTIDQEPNRVAPAQDWHEAPPQVIDIAAETLPSEGSDDAQPAGEGAEPAGWGSQAPDAADP